MVTLQQVEEQLKEIGCNYRFFGRPEIRELCNVLMAGETIAHCVNGHYEGGFAMLCVTDHRLLLIDRKPMFMALEDIRFDMIAEIDYSAQMLGGTMHLMLPNRKLAFTSWNHGRLRKLLNYTQERVMEMRQHFMLQQMHAAAAQQQMNDVAVGGLAVQGNQNTVAQQALGFSPFSPASVSNPYNKMPLLMRRRKFPKFY